MRCRRHRMRTPRPFQPTDYHFFLPADILLKNVHYHQRLPQVPYQLLPLRPYLPDQQTDPILRKLMQLEVGLEPS